MFRWLRPLLRAPELPPARPDWVDEVLEAIQRHGRASTKQSARLEAALADNDARIRALADAVEEQRAPAREADARTAAALHAPLFDALDALDEAGRLCPDPQLAAGLSRIAERVRCFCERAGFVRVCCEGAPPDARLARVVGTEAAAGAPAGQVTRVVRAPILHGPQLVREGEVIVSAARAPQEERDEHLGN